MADDIKIEPDTSLEGASFTEDVQYGDEIYSEDIEQTGSSEVVGRYTSRKLVLAVIAALLTFANFAFDLGLDIPEMLATISPLLAYIGVEGYRDIQEAKK